MFHIIPYSLIFFYSGYVCSCIFFIYKFKLFAKRISSLFIFTNRSAEQEIWLHNIVTRNILHHDTSVFKFQNILRTKWNMEGLAKFIIEINRQGNKTSALTVVFTWDCFPNSFFMSIRNKPGFLKIFLHDSIERYKNNYMFLKLMPCYN